ncbi:MAG: FHA domain-containing protein [Solirubrobacteraceae bacterium]
MSSKGVPRLEVVSGPARGARLAPAREGLEIGRDAGEDGRLGGDRELSRHHARISALEGKRLMVEDLGSTNGTLVNGEPIAGPTVVATGDTIEMGDTKLRVVSPAVETYGGVHTLPTNLLSVLAARAPVRREWVVKAFLTALAMVLAVNFILRTIAVEYLDVRADTPSMRPHLLFVISFMPTFGDSLGFYMSFRRPTSHSTGQYIAPAIAATLFFGTLETILLPSDATATEYVITMVVAVVPPTIILPTMLAVRVRAELAAQRRLGAPGAPS